MKLNRKNTWPLVSVVLLCAVAGTLAWFVLEIILGSAGLSFSPLTAKIGFDITVISFYMNANPGTVVGIGTGFFVFRTI